MTPMDEEVLGIDCQQWEITDWSSLPDRTQGPVFEVAGCHW